MRSPFQKAGAMYASLYPLQDTKKNNRAQLGGSSQLGSG